jgi:transposase
MSNKRYPRELRDRAVRLVLETRDQYPSLNQAIHSIGVKVGVGPESLRNWVRQAEVDAGARPGTTTDGAAEIKALKREVAELRRANEILKAAAGFFAAELCATRRRGDREVVKDHFHRAVAAAW